MRIALVIQDGRRQIVMQPESDDERAVLAAMHSEQWDLSVVRGRFGNAPRHSRWVDTTYCALEDQDTVLVMDRRQPEKA